MGARPGLQIPIHELLYKAGRARVLGGGLENRCQSVRKLLAAGHRSFTTKGLSGLQVKERPEAGPWAWQHPGLCLLEPGVGTGLTQSHW